MTVLSDRTIKNLLKEGRLKITPDLNDQQFQPVSIDVRLGREFIEVLGDDDLRKPIYADGCMFPHRLYPGDCILARTLERVEMPNNLVSRVEGKSTWGRRFITVHHTAGLIDPGFRGTVTLEIKNNGPAAVDLHPYDYIAQLTFEWTDVPVERPYGHPDLGSHYQGQIAATPPVKQEPTF